MTDKTDNADTMKRCVPGGMRYKCAECADNEARSGRMIMKQAKQESKWRKRSRRKRAKARAKWDVAKRTRAK